MDKLKQWVVLTVVAVLVVGAGGWFLLITPKRSEAADIRGQAARQVTANGQLQTQLAVLKSQAKDLPRQQAKLAAVSAKIPDNPALPSLIRALSKVAANTGVELVSISPSTPTPVAAAAGTPVVVAGTGAGTGATPAPVAASAGQLSSIGVSLSVAGSYFQVEQFLDGIEGLSRAMKVTGFTLTPGSNPVKPAPTGTVDGAAILTAAINSTIYLAPGRPSIPAHPVTAGAK